MSRSLIADYLTVRNAAGEVVTARPATTPTTPQRRRLSPKCSAAPVGSGQSAHPDENEIVDGKDELGVLLYGHDRNAYWYGSQLTVEETRALAPCQNATGLQVSSAVLAGMVWALENPEAGIVEADDMDYRRCLEIQKPYLGPVVGVYTDWTPLAHRPQLFAEDLDTSDPWQFRNVLVR
jgi:homospermidine synthase